MDQGVDMQSECSGTSNPSKKAVATLETLALNAYMVFLEGEAVSYVQLSQSPSRILSGMAEKLLQALKNQLTEHMGGVASSVLRDRMMSRILSDEYPTAKHCQRIALLRSSNSSEPMPGTSVDDHFTSLHCINPCCSGAFIRETMAGIVMSPDIRHLVFTSDKMPTSARAVALMQRGPKHVLLSATAIEFNVPVVLSHLLATTHGRYSQLETIVFSDSFVKEHDHVDEPLPPLVHKYRRLVAQQSDFASKFAEKKGLCETPDRRGVAMNMLILFRDVLPSNSNFSKLSELVLKNNIQCDLYSRANFQFEFLARVGISCPRLRVLDIFGTDTWADCLVAFFFRDAFHSLHRYLFFMENEEDESSAYHPHDTTRYCQFCLDQLHPTSVERPFTINPVIPLLDEVYDHVMKRYPKRSYCILRNCIKVSDLITSSKSNVFELIRSHELSEENKPDPLEIKETIGSRLKNRQPRLVNTPKDNKRDLRLSGKHKISVTHLHEPLRRSKRLKKDNEEATSDTNELWPVPRRSPSPKSFSTQIDNLVKNDSGVMTRSRKRRLNKSFPSDVSNDKVVTRSTRKSLEAIHFSGPSTKTAQGNGKKSKGVSETPFCDIKLATSDESCQNETIEFATWISRSLKCYCKGSKKCDVVRYEKDNPNAGLVELPIRCERLFQLNYDQEWVEPVEVKYVEISKWPHLNDCLQTLEVLNIGGTNVLGEFIPFILLHLPRLRSLGQWINTMIYGLEILRSMPGYENIVFPNIQEFSYSTDRNYFCHPYIGFVPETLDFRRVRKEMVRFSGKVAKKINNSNKNHRQKRNQISEDMLLMTSTCPNIKKVNIVMHYKSVVMHEDDATPWTHLASACHFEELDLVTMRFGNVTTLFVAVGPKLTSLTLEMDDEQGDGSEIVHIGRHCPNLVNLRLLIGDKVLKGEMTLHFGSQFFRKLEKLEVEGSVHLHAFAFLWGHCRMLKVLRLGLVISNEHTTSNVLILDVFSLMLQVNGMQRLEQMHIKNLKIKTLHMAKFLLDSLPSLKKVSNWLLTDFTNEQLIEFRTHLKQYVEKGIHLEFKEW